MVRKSLALIAILVALPLTIAACGDDDEDTTSASSTDTTTAAGATGESVAITETEFSIDPSDVKTKAGEVTFDITNDGGTVHNLEIEGNGVEEVSDDLDPGQKGELTVDLQPGTYEMYCAIGDHADQGMEGTLTVE